MSKKLKFNIDAIDGSFQREYDTVQEFKDRELGKYVGLSPYSMTSSDGICVYYPADDYTAEQIKTYQMIERAKDREDAKNLNTEVSIAKGIGLGYPNLYVMQQHNKENGNDDNYHIDTETGRFFIETKDDGSFFSPVRQDNQRFRVHSTNEKDMTSVFSNENLGFGAKKKEGINCFLLDTKTMLIQDTTKTHTSISSIRSMKSSKEKGTVAAMRTFFWDGNEDTPGSTYAYQPAIISADKETYFKILDAHYPECANDDYSRGSYDENFWMDSKSLGYVFDKDRPKPCKEVMGFGAKILKDNEVTEGEIVVVDKAFLDSMRSNDEGGLTVQMGDLSEIYLELGKIYEAAGTYYERDRSFTELPEGSKFTKLPEPDNDLDILF